MMPFLRVTFGFEWDFQKKLEGNQVLIKILEPVLYFIAKEVREIRFQQKKTKEDEN